MSLDIKVTIRNYIASDTYKVNIYRQGSVIPVATQEVARNGGSIVEFKDLPGGYTYEAEVIHYCTNGSEGKKKIIVTPSGVKICNCPSGYTANQDKTKCVKITTTQATPTVSYNVGLGPNHMDYNKDGARVYGPGFTLDGKGASVWDSGINHAYWANLGDITKGRLNIAGVWNAADSAEPQDTWIGFAHKIVVPESKVYYIGMAGDNYVRFKVNGQPKVDMKTYTGTEPKESNHFLWHIYPIYLNAGENIVETEGYNVGIIGCFAAEIYNCDLTTLQNVTPATEATLNRIFSTMEQTNFKGYTCPEGYALDNSNPAAPICKKIEYQACS